MKILISILIFSCALPLQAAFSNYNSLLIGNRSAGFGGAGVALSGDMSGAGFYNPALLTTEEGQSFSAAVGVYKKTDTLYGRDEDFSRAPLRVNLGFFRSLPASTGSVLRFGDHTLGLSILVPDYDSFKGDLRNTDDITTTYSFVDESLWVGPMWAKPLGEKSSLGLTLYYTARNFTSTLSDRVKESATQTKVYSLDKTLTQNALVAVIGWQTEVREGLRWGLSLRPRGVKVGALGSRFESQVQTDPVDVRFDQKTDLEAPVVIPARAIAGLSWQWHPFWVGAIDVSLHEGLTYNEFDNPTLGRRFEHRPTWNIQAGVEWALLEWLKVRGGGFTNFSAHPNPESGGAWTDQPDRVDQLGFSANAVFISAKGINYTFGGYYTGGRGRSLQRIGGQSEVINKSQQVFTMLVGTSIAL